ncbi:membrane protein [Clostridium pasteurianum]|nr:membrane protein [Clostridium pasteurianum]
MKKICNSIKKNLFSVIIVSLVLFIVIMSIIYNNELENVDSRNMFVVNRLSFMSIIIGILIGFFLAVFGEIWYRKRIFQNTNRETIKNYARIFKADIERSSRLFKNKRFELIRISNITIVKNWLEAFGYISAEFSKEELEQFINYYSRINKLIEYEKRINEHLEGMQSTTLKDYPYMKEYKDLIAVFSFEINNLFKVDITKLKEKLNLICNQCK